MTQRLSTMDLPFLRKPYRIDALHQAIDAALRHLSEASGRR